MVMESLDGNDRYRFDGNPFPKLQYGITLWLSIKDLILIFYYLAREELNGDWIMDLIPVPVVMDFST